jgi:predicted RNA-binding Zn ribbon-like protein
MDCMGTKATEPVFDLSGGALCLDLVNTVSDWPRASKDDLPNYRALVAWGRQSGVLADEEAERLSRSAARRPEAAARTFRKALDLRAGLYRIFAAVATGESPSARDLSAFNRLLGEAMVRLRVSRSKGGFEWGWSAENGALDRVLWPVLRSAAVLLTSDRRDRIRQCASDTCSWFFVDRSRGGQRRWCDMAVCGNRAKARRYYRRKKDRSQPG